MKREIKFEVWDIDCKVMRDWDWVRKCEWPFYSTNQGVDLLNDKHFSLRQFIGLRDKNNKQIHEGDILKGFHWESKEDELIGEVYYMCGQWYLWDEFYLHECLGSNRDPDKLYDFEIIGNKFENPDLLKP